MQFINQRWWGKGLFFECIGCGRCCRGEPGAVWFTSEEGEAIAAYLKMTPGEFAASCVTRVRGRKSLREHTNGDCMFLDTEKQRCRIYPVRPAQCGLFPFWPSLMLSEKRWRAHARSCPGMNRGKLYTPEDILELLRRAPFEDL